MRDNVSLRVSAGASLGKGKAFPRRVISIASGKGGVGKTLSTVNLALAAQRMGHPTLILDGDLGLANVDVLLGLQATYNINDVLEGTASLKDIVLSGPLGVRVIPSGSGVSRLAQLSYLERLQILEQIEAIQDPYDVLLIDTGAGISPNVLHLNAVADDVVVVTTPEPHAMTDAYAFIKVMREEYQRKDFFLLVNMVRCEEEGLKVARRMSDVAKKFINADITMLGSVPVDPQVQKAVMFRRAASEDSTHTIAGQEWNKMSRILFQNVSLAKANPGFWRSLVHPMVGQVSAPAY